MRYWGHHMLDIVYESPDKDGFSIPVGPAITLVNGWTHMHEMVWIVFIGDVKCIRIVGLYHVIRFFCLPLYFVLVWKESILLLLLLWGKRDWLLLLHWGKRVWLLLLLWGNRV